MSKTSPEGKSNFVRPANEGGKNGPKRDLQPKKTQWVQRRTEIAAHSEPRRGKGRGGAAPRDGVTRGGVAEGKKEFSERFVLGEKRWLVFCVPAGSAVGKKKGEGNSRTGPTVKEKKTRKTPFAREKKKNKGWRKSRKKKRGRREEDVATACQMKRRAIDQCLKFSLHMEGSAGPARKKLPFQASRKKERRALNAPIERNAKAKGALSPDRKQRRLLATRGRGGEREQKNRIRLWGWKKGRKTSG